MNAQFKMPDGQDRRGRVPVNERGEPPSKGEWNGATVRLDYIMNGLNAGSLAVYVWVNPLAGRYVAPLAVGYEKELPKTSPPSWIINERDWVALAGNFDWQQYLDERVRDAVMIARRIRDIIPENRMDMEYVHSVMSQMSITPRKIEAANEWLQSVSPEWPQSPPPEDKPVEPPSKRPWSVGQHRSRQPLKKDDKTPAWLWAVGALWFSGAACLIWWRM